MAKSKPGDPAGGDGDGRGGRLDRARRRGGGAAYHLAELEIASDPGHPGHVNPPIPRHARVLDVGCGAGQTLIAAARDEAAVGVDLDLGALRLGRTLSRRILFVCASGERLPFPAASFDLAVSRVALPYMHLRTALPELRRVLRPGGTLWATLHRAAIPWQALRRANARGKLYHLGVLVNGLLLHLTLRQVRLPGGGCESFQTRSAIRRALAAAGFEEIVIPEARHFIVTARAPGTPPAA